ncbi:hypothetical protein J2W63_002750 [Klebsiella sp. 1400]|nr:hypothetical protein [Klebsiella sp. 1400]
MASMTIGLQWQSWLQPAKRTAEMVTGYRYRTGGAGDR